MQLVERHAIKQTGPRSAVIDRAAFASKTLYNAANYVVRQSFIHEGVSLTYHEMRCRMKDHNMKDHKAYKASPAKFAQWVPRLLDQKMMRGAGPTDGPAR